MHALELVEARTSEATKLGLKSSAAVIRAVCPLIAEARRAGFSHRTIYSALCAAGLEVTWTNYRIALGRANSATNRSPDGNDPLGLVVPPEPRVEPIAATDETGVAKQGWQPRAEVVPGHATGSSETNTFALGSTGTSNSTRVMDALRQAREVANSKDYGQIARDLYRQEQRNRRTKDRS